MKVFTSFTSAALTISGPPVTIEASSSNARARPNNRHRINHLLPCVGLPGLFLAILREPGSKTVLTGYIQWTAPAIKLIFT